MVCKWWNGLKNLNIEESKVLDWGMKCPFILDEKTFYVRDAYIDFGCELFVQ